jgi:hypothetical protein
MSNTTLLDHYNWKWPAIITISTALVTALILNDVQGPVRTVVAAWFLFICPGMSFVRLLRLPNQAHQFVLAVALSLVLELLIAMVVVYMGAWSMTLVLAILVVLTSVGVIWQLLLWLGALARTTPPPAQMPPQP